MSDKELGNATEQDIPTETERGKIKRLFLIRHGSYNSEGNLDDGGRKDIEELSRKISQLVNNEDSVLILSSPAPRAKESAEIIAGVLQSSVETNNALFTKYESINDTEFQNVLNLIQSVKDRVSLLILVTHGPIVDRLSTYTQAYDWQLTRWRSVSAYKGEGILIDYEDKFITKL